MSAVLIVILMFIVFVLGAESGALLVYLAFVRKRPAQVQEPASPTDAEIEAAKREREELIASQKAFQQMVGYNADIAYGIEDTDFTSGGN
jgi:hypothetical protein